MHCFLTYCISYLAWFPKGHQQVPCLEAEWEGKAGIASVSLNYGVTVG